MRLYLDAFVVRKTVLSKNTFSNTIKTLPVLLPLKKVTRYTKLLFVLFVYMARSVLTARFALDLNV